MPAPKGHPPYNVNGEGGRPKTYTDEVIEKFADDLEEWLKIETNYWYNDFCLDQGIDSDYMSEWAKQNERFRGVYKLAKKTQESRMFKGAMIGNYNNNMTKLGLTNWHGWEDKTSTKNEHTVKGLEDIMEVVSDSSKDLVNTNED